MSMSREIRSLADVEELYTQIRGLDRRLEFWIKYFSFVAPRGLRAEAAEDEAGETRKAIWLVTTHSDSILMTGICHGRGDLTAAAEVSRDETYTRIDDDINWERYGPAKYRFFTVYETMRFYKGEMRTGIADLDYEFHPVYDIQKVHEYLARRLEPVIPRDR